MQPAVCEAHPDAAAALNVPTKLLDSLEQHKAAKGCDPLLIHFSTDQVRVPWLSMLNELRLDSGPALDKTWGELWLNFRRTLAQL